jgi:hypothetical protein
MKYALYALCILIDCLPCLSQPVCRSTDYRKNELQAHPGLAQAMASIEAFTANTLRNRPVIVTGGSTGSPTTTEVNNGTVPLITIPVVVHIVYQTSAENISDEQVQSQIAILNLDYQKRNPDTAEIPTYYRSLAANCGFRFGLAQLDTNGQATTGIVRRQTNVARFTIDDGIKFTASGGDDGWDRDLYLNIWVGNLTGGILGYSSIVGGAKATDGVVVLYTAFGTNGTATAPFNLGRTTVHEVGHWLNMIHTWGDDSCGNDQVGDTPPQEGPDYGDPGGIVISCGNEPYGNLYQDYMDFTDDIGMHLFTYGQRDRMRTLFAPGGFRYPLLSSNVPVALPDSAAMKEGSWAAIGLYPNPAFNAVTVSLTDNGYLDQPLTIYDQLGQRVLETQVTSLMMLLDISSLNKGVYYISVSDGKGRNLVKLVKM